MHESGSNVDKAQLKFLLENIHLIVRMQAFYRGHIVRKKLFRTRMLNKRSLVPPRSMMTYASNDTNH